MIKLGIRHARMKEKRKSSLERTLGTKHLLGPKQDCLEIGEKKQNLCSSDPTIASPNFEYQEK
jgi:hypothetical protein